MKPKQNTLNSERLSFTKEASFLTGQHLPKSLSEPNLTKNVPPPNSSKWAWLIETGVVKTYTWDEEGNQIILGYWGMGDLIGQPLSMVSPYEMQCCTAVTAQRVPPTLWCSWGQCLSHHCQQGEELLLINRCEPIRKRLRLFLVWLANKFGQRMEQGWYIGFRLTHQELADAIGSSRVTVTRLLSQLEQQGIIIRLDRSYIVVKNLTQ